MIVIFTDAMQRRAQRTIRRTNTNLLNRAQRKIRIKQPATSRRTDEIAEKILSRQRRDACAAIDKSADDGSAIVVSIFHDRIDQRRIWIRIGRDPARVRVEKEASLFAIPSIIA